MKTFLLYILALFTFFCLMPTASAQEFLHCRGRYIYDRNGNEVILRGIGTGNWMLQEGYMMQTSGVAGTQHEFRRKLTETIGEEKTAIFYQEWLNSHMQRADIDSMKSWGFNSVRAAMHYKWFTPPIEEEPVSGEITFIDTGFILIDSLLEWCSTNEMYLILDLHGAPGGQGKDANISDYDSSKPSLWESQANKDKTVALWRKIAERYSNEPWIGGYDLINETNWTFPEGNNSKLRELMVNITKSIREVDQNHIIFIEGNEFANNFSGLTPPWDNNMAYSFHKYWNYNTQQSLSFAINLRNSHNVPIWLGESGENSNVWFTSLIELCEKNRIGWAMWPLKKPGFNNPLKVNVNIDYTKLINYWKGTAANPGSEAAFDAVMQFARNHRIQNCIFMKDVVDAMIRLPFTTETTEYEQHRTGEPVFAVNYNMGRNNFAYFDKDTANHNGSTGEYTDWNKGWSYRNDGVDIETCSDNDTTIGFSIGWTEDGEWMEYTILVDSTAAYDLDIRSASNGGGATVHLEIDGNWITPAVKLPSTSGWQAWRTTTIKGIILHEGLHKIKFVFDKGGSNLNYFKLSQPVPVDSIRFSTLSALSSADGGSVILMFNKAVTSENEIDPSEFTLTIDNNPVKLTSISFVEENPYKLVLNLEEPLYYNGKILLTWQGNSVRHQGTMLEAFTKMEVINHLPVRYNLPGRIQSENFSFNHGLEMEKCEDTGGGFDMGYANPGDYLDYLVHVPEASWYTIHFRVATIRASSRLVIKIGDGNDYVPVDTLEIKSTGGWQTWKTISTTVWLPQGRYTMRMFVLSGEFNTNWFHPVKSTSVKAAEPRIMNMKIYPNPARDYVIFESPFLIGQLVNISIYNIHGQPVKTLNEHMTSHFKLDVSDLKQGIYYLMVLDENKQLLFANLILQ